MLKKVTIGLVVFATATFGMSLSQLNSATKAELTEIKGIGVAKADSIIKELKNGKFKSFDGLIKRVKGIGEHMATNIKNDIKSGDKTKKQKAKEPKKKTHKKTKTKNKDKNKK